MENRKLIKNVSSGENFFVSVAPVRKSISIPMKLGDLQAPSLDFDHIIFEAAIYKDADIKSLTPKPFLVINLEDGMSEPESQENFEKTVFNIIENTNLYNDDLLQKDLKDVGYENIIQKIWNLFFLADIKHVFIFKR